MFGELSRFQNAWPKTLRINAVTQTYWALAFLDSFSQTFGETSPSVPSIFLPISFDAVLRFLPLFFTYYFILQGVRSRYEKTISTSSTLELLVKEEAQEHQKSGTPCLVRLTRRVIYHS